MTAWLTGEQVAELLSCSRRTVTELVRTKRIPHRKVAGVRRVFFVEAEIVAWIDGARDLEVVRTSDGGRVVRPKQVAS